MARFSDLLKKKVNNEELSPEEEALLAEFEEDTKELTDKIAFAEQEKKAEALKAKNAKTELQNKLKELSEKETQLTEISEKKTSLEEELKKATDLKSLQDKFEEEKKKEAQLELERKLAEEKKKAEEAKLQALSEKDKQFEDLKTKYEELNSMTKVMEFKNTVNAEKVNRPYLADKLGKLLETVTYTNLVETQGIFNFLINSVNHEEEMAEYNSKTTAGTSIFKGVKEETSKIEVKDDFEEFLKKNPNLK